MPIFKNRCSKSTTYVVDLEEPFSSTLAQTVYVICYAMCSLFKVDA